MLGAFVHFLDGLDAVRFGGDPRPGVNRRHQVDLPQSEAGQRNELKTAHYSDNILILDLRRSDSQPAIVRPGAAPPGDPPKGGFRL